MRLRNIIWSCNECIPNFHYIVRAKNLFQTSYKTGSLYLTLLLVCAMLLTGCSAGSQKTRGGAQQEEVDYSVKGSRPSTPNVLIPRQSGKNVIGSDEVEVDISNLQDGYLSVRWLSDPPKLKLQLTSDDEVTYTYDLPSDGSWTVFPLSSGSGRYLLGIYNNIEATMYAESFSTDLDVELTDEFGPFLYPNQYCWFTGSTGAPTPVRFSLNSGQDPVLRAAAPDIVDRFGRLEQEVFLLDSHEVTEDVDRPVPLEDSAWNGPPEHSVVLHGRLIEWSCDAIGWLMGVLGDVAALSGVRTPLLMTARREERRRLGK